MTHFNFNLLIIWITKVFIKNEKILYFKEWLTFSVMRIFTTLTYIVIFIYNTNLTRVIQNGDSCTLDNAIMNLYKKVSCIKSYFKDSCFRSLKNTITKTMKWYRNTVNSVIRRVCESRKCFVDCKVNIYSDNIR